MGDVFLGGRLDIAELVFYIFFIFFIGLVIWLRREDRREGYPLETDVGGHLHYNDSPLQMAPAKTFHLPFDQGTATVPRRQDEPLEVPNARRTAPWPGSPWEPVGDPIGAGVGPGAYAQRAKYPDMTEEGHPRIVPIGAAPGFGIAPRDVDPRGLDVIGADGAVAGKVSDIWVDRSDMLIRYLEVATGTGSALMPMTMAKVNGRRGTISCSALNAAQFAGAPKPATAGTLTRDEEERIVAYFGGGYLYANPQRQEPWM